MRYVDIERLHLPVGWQARADEALNQLRHEVSEAENTALASGMDPIAARRKALSAGLAVAARQQIWRDLSPHLSNLTEGKCWYSESRNPTADKNVDHFRPKARVSEVPEHEGYWWLAFQWRNYRYASQWCNQRRVDDINGTSGGKGDQFPLCAGSVRAMREADDWHLEHPQLLDPVDPDDWRLLTFRGDGYPTPSKNSGTIEFERAERSIDVYHLRCRELVNERRVVAGEIQRLIEEMDMIRPQITNAQVRTLYKNHQKRLLRAIDPNAEYSAAALAFARAEIQTVIAGQQVRRDWLAEMLT
jgi:uncharacterized protein (TIGR02646 family)